MSRASASYSRAGCNGWWTKHDPASGRVAPGSLVCNAEVLAAADELAKRLRSPGHLAARGLARVHLLLTDCHSPLYLRSATGELRVTVSRAFEALEPTTEW